MLFSMSRISDSPMKNRENRKISATSPEKEDRYYTTRGSMGMMDDNGKVLMDHGGEDRGTVWPKLFISLSSKEKEEDFMAMKGCKLPQRPKKRAKLIQKTLLVSNFFPISSLNSQKDKIRENRGFEKKFQFLWCGCVLIWFLWLLCSWWVQVHGYQTCAKRGMKWGRRRLPRRCFFFGPKFSPHISIFPSPVWLMRKFTEELLNMGFFPNWNTQNKKSSPNKANRTIKPHNLFSFLVPQFSQPPKGGFLDHLKFC